MTKEQFVQSVFIWGDSNGYDADKLLERLRAGSLGVNKDIFTDGPASEYFDYLEVQLINKIEPDIEEIAL